MEAGGGRVGPFYQFPADNSTAADQMARALDYNGVRSHTPPERHPRRGGSFSRTRTFPLSFTALRGAHGGPCPAPAHARARVAQRPPVRQPPCIRPQLELDSVWTNGEFTVLSDRPPPRKKGLAAAGFGLDGDDDGDFTFEEREVRIRGVLGGDACCAALRGEPEGPPLLIPPASRESRSRRSFRWGGERGFRAWEFR